MPRQFSVVAAERALRCAAAAALFFVGGCCRPQSPAVQPARVVSGSMAPHWVGEHWEVVCEDCGYTIFCGVEHPPRGGKAVCPNCGYAENEIDEARVLPGTAVNVAPRDFSADPPRRWEVIAFAEPGAEDIAVKRVVGLPGERLAIREGDIFVDGKRLQKSPGEFAEIGQPLYHPSCIPRLTKGFPARWRPADNSRWQAIAPDESGASYCCDRSDESSATIDWLEYHHVNPLAGPLPRTAAARILDNYAYNQGLSRQLNAVTDVVLQCGVRLSDGGELRVRLLGGEQPLFVTFSPAENSVRLWRGERRLAEAPTSTPLAGGTIWHLSVGIIDRRVLIVIDENRALTFDLDSLEPSPQPVDVALAVGTRDLDAEITLPRVFRDIYYLNPHQRPDAWEMDKPLGEDEYFLLGDNPPNSRDSRHYGPIRRDAIVGGVQPREEGAMRQNE